MMHYEYSHYWNWLMPFGGFPGWHYWGFVFLLLTIWSLYWKARALWRAAQTGEKRWFIALLIINTAGILEILYLYAFSKPSNTTSTIPPKAE